MISLEFCVQYILSLQFRDSGKTNIRNIDGRIYNICLCFYLSICQHYDRDHVWGNKNKWLSLILCINMHYIPCTTQLMQYKWISYSIVTNYHYNESSITLHYITCCVNKWFILKTIEIIIATFNITTNITLQYNSSRKRVWSYPDIFNAHSNPQTEINE